MKRIARGQTGTIAVIAAVALPVFMLLLALVMDVGNWYTHKRQLQNRADAAAFAAGVAYAKNWKACVQDTDATAKQDAADAIADAARQYAGDPEASDYKTVPTSEYNTEVANQSKLDVVINSTSYDNDTDSSDGGNPCFKHPSGTDAISPAGGEWTDVKVKETDLPSFVPGILKWFGADTVLSRNGARARVEIRPVASGSRFLPLAIPDTTMAKVQIRYYDGCRPSAPPLAIKDLAPIPGSASTDYSSLGGGSLWGLPAKDGDLSVGDPKRGFDLTIPSYDPRDCSGPYLPIKVETRFASRDQIDLNQSCSALASLPFADCFSNVSQIRVWPDGNPNAHPLIKNVDLTGGCNSYADAYFSAYGGTGTASCNFGASVDVDFGNRYPSGSNFRVTVNGQDLVAPGANPTGIWTSSGGLSASGGPHNVTVQVFWKPSSGGNQNYSEVAQQTFVGTGDTAGGLDLVRTSASAFNGTVPGPPFDNVTSGSISKQLVYPTVGFRSKLTPGVLATIRDDVAQGSQLVQCDPSVPNGQDLKNFFDGCQPWYGENPFTDGIWWNTSTQSCPSYKDWYKTNAPAPYTNSPTNPWRCVKNAPGKSLGQSGDWFAVATGNCNALNGGNNQCSSYRTTTSTPKANCGNYDGKPGEPNGWLANGGDSGDPRVVSLFIVPYQALKGISGSGKDSEIPILGFASFYIMNWKGQKAAESDPCPDPDLNGVTVNPPGPGSAIGVFVEAVEYSTGPVDPNAFCTQGQLLPCRAVLVR